MFEKVVFDYDAKGIKVVPITPGTKACKVSDWINVDFTECAEKYTGFGVGLSLGCSDLVMLDLDFEDEQTKREVEEFLKDYPTPIMRLGNPNRPPARFYQKSWQKGSVSQAVKGGAIEIRSVRPGGMSQVVIPPTIHPESGTPYRWVGTHNLLNFDLDQLPVFPIEAWEKLKESFGKSVSSSTNNDVELVQNEPNRCMNGSNIKYSAMVRAAVLEEKSIEEIVKDLIYFDEKHQKVKSFFLCKHGKSWKHKTIEENAEDFVRDAYARAIRQGEVRGIGAGKTISISTKDIQEVKVKREKYPKFRGVAQEMFQYIYENSPIPRSRMSCSAVLSLMSITLANKIKINGIHPNLYNLMIAPSGFGKDFPLKFVKRALMESGHRELIGQSMPASDTGIIKTLENQKERIDIIDEASILFGAITSGKNDYSSKMADVYAALYTSSGDFFEGKVLASNNKVIGACHSPYVSILGAMTPAAASETISTQLIQTGLGARFLYFIDDQKKKGRLVSERPPIPRNIKRFIQMWRKDTDQNRINIASGFQGENARSATVTNFDFLHGIYDQIEEMKLSCDQKIAPLLNRAFPIICKLALIDACSIQEKTTNIEVREENFSWAQEFFRVNFRESVEFITDSISDSKNERNLNKMHEFIKSHKTKGVTMSQLCRGMRQFDARQRKSLIDDLIEADLIISTKEETGKKPKIKFYSKKYIKIP